MSIQIHASFFSCVTDTRPIQRALSPDRLLDSLTTRIWMPAVAGDARQCKCSTPLISGASYPPGASRCRDNVEGVQIATLDVDNCITTHPGEYYRDRIGTITNRPILMKAPAPNSVTFPEAVAMMRRAGLSGVVYTTISHRDLWPKVRILALLEAPVPASDWPRAAGWILERLGLDQRLECVDLHHLNNPASMAVLPTRPLHGPLLRERLDGELLSVHLKEIRHRPILSPPEPEWRQALRLERIARASIEPRPHGIWERSCDPADLLRQLGCEIFSERPWIHGTKRRTTCPWACEHTGGLDDDSGIVFYPTIGRPSWRCAHAGHMHLGVTDLLRSMGRF